MKLRAITLAALAAFTLAGSASAATLLFSDNFNTAGENDAGFNDSAKLIADQSGTAATKTYATVGAEYSYQRGNAGEWLMYANGAEGNTNKRGSLNYDIAAAANSLSSALEIKFNMSVLAAAGGDTTQWTSFTVGNQNPFVNSSSVGFSSLFRDNGGTQQFSNTTLNGFGEASQIGNSATFTDGQLITLVFSDATGSGSAFGDGNGANDIVKMYVNGSLTNTFTGLNLGTDDQYISFHAGSTIARIDNLSITAIPEPRAALLGGLGMLALLRRRR